jgi:LPS export ABC transporter protein LptC
LAVCFAITALAIAVNVILSIMTSKSPISREIDLSTDRSDAFIDLSYRTHNADGREITLASDKMHEEAKKHYVFEKMTSNFTLSNGEKGTVSADRAKAVRDDKTICEFTNNVKLSTASGLQLRTEKSTVNLNAKIVDGESPVSIRKDDSNISADRYSFDIGSNILTLTGHVAGVMAHKTSISSDKIIVTFDGSVKNSIKNVKAIGNARLLSPDYDLRARGQIVYDDSRLQANSGVVFVHKKNADYVTIHAQRMTAFLNKNASLREATADGGLIIHQKNVTIESNSGIFRDNKIIASGNVVISGDQGEVFGDAVELDTLTGNVSVKKSSGIIKSVVRDNEKRNYLF